MLKRFFILTIIGLLANSIYAQSLQEAKRLFQKGEYEKCKPAFRRFVKRSPRSSTYNYWYGKCCAETGELKKSVKYLKYATSRKIRNAFPELGKVYNQLYRFDDAIEIYEDYIKITERRKQHDKTEETQKLIDTTKKRLRMLKGVERVCIIDSFIVDKDNFLANYKISRESGNLYSYYNFFEDEPYDSLNSDAIVYQTELKNKIFFSKKNNDSIYSIYTKNKLIDKWSDAKLLSSEINNEGYHTNYPFVMADGITIYYASEGEKSLGGYDIFVTRYNQNSDNYFEPANLGMPFNSFANDYMLVIDEYKNLGWFATDRNQPEDKVCIYVFIPNSSKETYNYESIDKDQIINLAQIKSIKDTWSDADVVKAAKERLHSVKEYAPQVKNEVDFTFIVDDNVIYHHLSDFKSGDAQQVFQELKNVKAELKDIKEKLSSFRAEYDSSNASNKSIILDLEKRERVSYHQIKLLEKRIRILEKEVNK